MPFSYDPNLEDEKKRKEQEQGGSQQLVSGQAGTVQGQVQQPSNSTTSQSGQYTNLKDYLDANKSLNFGSAVADKVQGDVQGGYDAQAGLKDQFGQQAQSGTISYNEGVANKAKDQAASLSDEEKQQFKGMQNAEYQGPKYATDLEGYNQTSQKTLRGQQVGELSKNEAGQRSLIKDYYGRPDYTAGQLNLDQFLVKGDQAAKPKFQQAQQQAGMLGQNLDQLNQDLNLQGQQAQETTQATKNRLLEEFLGPQGELYKEQQAIRDTVGQAQGQNDQYYNELLAQLRGNQAPSQDLQGIRTYGLDPGAYVGRNPANYDYNQTVSPEMAQQYAALSGLLGQGQEFLDPSKAGTFDPRAGISVDAGRLRSDSENITNQIAQMINDNSSLGENDFQILQDPYVGGKYQQAKQEYLNTLNPVDRQNMLLPQNRNRLFKETVRSPIFTNLLNVNRLN